MASSTSDRSDQLATDHPLRSAVIAAVLAVASIAILLAASVLLRNFTGGPPDELTLAVAAAPKTTSADHPRRDRDTRQRQRIVGTWRDHYQGERTMTVRDDGTATMIVVFRGMKARLFTPRLVLEMVWSVRDGQMTRRTTGGTPPEKVEFVNRYAGRQVSEQILKLTDRQLILLDQDGATRYVWRRVADRN